ncbi:hypothetical protein GA0074692_3557 [Micromonospora pallida]|uniref:Uncharacterized protein n=1 Tax=Micromonospora pallida TaxID=145854 RepID=A0A1C6SV52_9ACTN|nr:hypothetical protein GA0074692_3557 [Micromonospora pallida]
MAVERGFEPGTDVLIRKVDSHLAAVRVGLDGPELELAERLARCLRELVAETAQASAADRAQVRAAVHYFVLRRESRGRLLSVRSLAAAQRLVNRVAVQLGRPDLLVESRRDGAPRERAVPVASRSAPIAGRSTEPAVPVPGRSADRSAPLAGRSAESPVPVAGRPAERPAPPEASRRSSDADRVVNRAIFAKRPIGPTV